MERIHFGLHARDLHHRPEHRLVQGMVLGHFDPLGPEQPLHHRRVIPQPIIALSELADCIQDLLLDLGHLLAGWEGGGGLDHTLGGHLGGATLRAAGYVTDQEVCGTPHCRVQCGVIDPGPSLLTEVVEGVEYEARLVDGVDGHVGERRLPRLRGVGGEP